MQQGSFLISAMVTCASEISHEMLLWVFCGQYLHLLIRHRKVTFSSVQSKGLEYFFTMCEYIYHGSQM